MSTKRASAVHGGRSRALKQPFPPWCPRTTKSSSLHQRRRQCVQTFCRNQEIRRPSSKGSRGWGGPRTRLLSRMQVIMRHSRRVRSFLPIRQGLIFMKPTGSSNRRMCGGCIGGCVNTNRQGPQVLSPGDNRSEPVGGKTDLSRWQPMILPPVVPSHP